ncbi:unnamed protein product, partial [Symbiodinium sp. KB8]
SVEAAWSGPRQELPVQPRKSLEPPVSVQPPASGMLPGCVIRWLLKVLGYGQMALHLLRTSVRRQSGLLRLTLSNLLILESHPQWDCPSSWLILNKRLNKQGGVDDSTFEELPGDQVFAGMFLIEDRDLVLQLPSPELNSQPNCMPYNICDMCQESIGLIWLIERVLSSLEGFPVEITSQAHVFEQSEDGGEDPENSRIVTDLLTDSQSAIDLLKGQVRLEWIPGSQNPADLFTKNVNTALLNLHRGRLGFVTVKDSPVEKLFELSVQRGRIEMYHEARIAMLEVCCSAKSALSQECSHQGIPYAGVIQKMQKLHVYKQACAIVHRWREDGGLITLTFRHPVMVTVQMEKSQHDYANRGKTPVEPGSSAMPKSAKAKARREPVQTQADGTFFKNRHHFAICLDDEEAVYHKTSDCAKSHATRVEPTREILPCGVCRAVANADSSVCLSKYGDKYHSMDCKHVQQKNSHIHGLTACSECWSGPLFLE